MWSCAISLVPVARLSKRICSKTWKTTMHVNKQLKTFLRWWWLMTIFLWILSSFFWEDMHLTIQLILKLFAWWKRSCVMLGKLLCILYCQCYLYIKTVWLIVLNQNPLMRVGTSEATRKNLWRRALWFTVLDVPWPCLSLKKWKRMWCVLGLFGFDFCHLQTACVPITCILWL